MPCHHDAYDSVHHNDINATQFTYSTVNFNYSTIFHRETRLIVTIPRHFFTILTISACFATLRSKNFPHFVDDIFIRFIRNANEYTIIYEKLIPSIGLFCVYCGQKVNNSDDCYTIPHQNPHSFHHRRLHLNFHHHRNFKPAICLALNTVDTTRSSITYIRRVLIIGKSTATFLQNILNNSPVWAR